MNNSQVSNSEGRALANAHNMSFMATCATTGSNVTTAFFVLAQRLVEESVKMNNPREFPQAGDVCSFERLEHDSSSGVLQLGRTISARVRRLCDFV